MAIPRFSKVWRAFSTAIRQEWRNSVLEKLARTKKLLVPLNVIRQEWVTDGNWASHVNLVARHYGIYQHLFGGVEFLPKVDMTIEYGCRRVHAGNHVAPIECKDPPIITYDSNSLSDGGGRNNSWWTLLMSNPDGNACESDAEMLHWLVYNIPRNRVSDGTVYCPYLTPLPARGTGFHRIVFILFRQREKMDLPQKIMKALHDRTFVTRDFWNERKAILQPAGLHFLQASWDESVSDAFADLGIAEPTYVIQEPKTVRQKKRERLRRVHTNRYRDINT
ncbi:large ribosomal subunit protein mL38-like [Oscarella lobularis]|uniref:large ribosomal subunit protein mL38-like n=1 Tax=Oscarella lobularis TaxID=121494 RepID=UPI00331318EC